MSVFFTAKDLATRYGVTTNSITKWTKDGLIPALKIGGHYRYDPAAIEGFEERGGMK